MGNKIARTTQLLFAVKQSHENGVCHGVEGLMNVLVTSWNWLYLADFDRLNPLIYHMTTLRISLFSLTLVGGGDAILLPRCVIPELFLEGQPLFELSKLLAYRRGQYDPSQSLEKIPDSGIRKMILHMIQLDPKSRLSDDSFRVTSLHFFIIFFSCFIPLDSDTRVAVTQSAFHDIHKQMKNNRLNVEIRGGISRTCSLSESERSPQVMEGGNLILNSPKESSKKKGELD
ncbi:hypothetical protein C5167_035293 [Papaver somniferum]|uniref:Protein kinase domain-containing protein n=1 Tax=Papaver somniferum TaxID=3469 RepID=A0A4Y7KF35_PAPSO|nr:hypothetical protein C5167_035293 [Papaver somniferum]